VEIIDEVLPILRREEIHVPSITQWLGETIKENRKYEYCGFRTVRNDWRNTGGTLAELKVIQYNDPTICSANDQPAPINSGK
jgi:hypothetical protein